MRCAPGRGPDPGQALGEIGRPVRHRPPGEQFIEKGGDHRHPLRRGDGILALAEEGFSLRETATLLGLSHQRVDQILGSHCERKQSNVLVLCEGPSDAAWLRQAMPSAERGDFAPVFVVVGGSLDSWVVAAGGREDKQARNHFWALLQEVASRASGDRNRTDPKVSSRASDWSPQDSRRSRQEAAVAARGKAGRTTKRLPSISSNRSPQSWVLNA